MMILRWFYLSMLLLVADIAALFLVPIAVLLADSQGRLPKIFRWLETHDDLGWGAGVYEPTIRDIFNRFGPRMALIWWLWRNKAMALRNHFRANPDYAYMVFKTAGSEPPPRFGPWYWLVRLRSRDQHWFELHLGFSLVKFHLSIRTGWKLNPYLRGHRPTDPARSATGSFVGISLRSENWSE